MRDMLEPNTTEPDTPKPDAQGQGNRNHPTLEVKNRLQPLWASSATRFSGGVRHQQTSPEVSLPVSAGRLR
jgi:hypothetical protein